MVSALGSLRPDAGNCGRFINRPRARKTGAQLRSTCAGPGPGLGFHHDLSFLSATGTGARKPCKAVSGERSYDEVLRCRTSAPSITLAWEPQTARPGRDAPIN